MIFLDPDRDLASYQKDLETGHEEKAGRQIDFLAAKPFMQLVIRYGHHGKLIHYTLMAIKRVIK